MKFSIIVPVYNVEEYIEQCLSSLLEQDVTKLEIILIDDGSTDHSGNICDQYAQKYGFVQVYHQNNMGAAEARNVGIIHATGDYILFVDGDDCIVDNMLSKIEASIIKAGYPDLVFLECEKVIFDCHNHAINQIPMLDGVTNAICGLDRSSFLKYIAELPKYPASPCTKAIKREVFSQNNVFFKKGLLNEDLEWAVKLFLNVNSVSYCSQDYYLYRQNRAHSSSALRSEKKAMDMLYIVEQWIANLADCTSSAEQHLIKSVMEYLFRFLLIDIHYLSWGKRSLYKKRIRACDMVLGTRNDSVSKLIRFSYSICGISMTGFLLRIYLEMRNRKQRYISITQRFTRPNDPVGML